MSGHGCTSEDMHPYECDGVGRCCHCDRRMVFEGSGPQRHHAVDMIEDATRKLVHDPASCSLCDPAYDHGPAYESLTIPPPSLSARGGDAA
jgi:hypothetical protein